MVAESVTDCPTRMELEESVVVIVGVAFWTFNGSQGEDARLLLGSPE